MTLKRISTVRAAAHTLVTMCLTNLFLMATAMAAEGAELTESGFRPASEVEKDTVDGGLLLIVAYAIAWVLIAGYVFIVAKRARQANIELNAVRLLARDLEVRLDESEAAK